jgi:hypothetical protein
MAWRKALTTYGAWVGAHTVAGLAFVVVVVDVVPDRSFWVLLLHGLLAGAIYGFAQWLVLRWSLPEVRWWLPATAAASPFSWFFGYWLGAATFTLGGWLGGAFSALLQVALLALAFREDARLAILSVVWLPAALLGSLIFYFAYIVAVSPGPSEPPPWESLLVGSVGFGAVTGPVVALLAGLVDSPQERQHALHQ